MANNEQLLERPVHRPKAENILTERELIEAEYAPVTELLLDETDKQEVEADPKRKSMLQALETHEKIVLDYANELIKANPSLTPDQRVAATLAAILHDSGKLSSPLLEHHLKGATTAEKILNELKKLGETFEGVAITDEIIKKVKEAIERHMNHPFLVKMNRARFPEPEDEVDKIVFDADMLANIGFKNVMFRLIDPRFLKEDREAAADKNITPLQANFANVMESVKELKTVALSPAAKELVEKLIEAAEAIYEKMDFDKIEKKLLGVEESEIIKNYLNQEIEKSGAEICEQAEIDVKNFLL